MRSISLGILMAVVLTAGCQWSETFHNRRDVRLSPLGCSTAQSELNTNLALALPPQPQSDFAPERWNFENRVQSGLVHIELLEVIELGLSNSRIVRVSDGADVIAADSTFYDIETSEALESAALAAFDTNFTSSIFGRDIKRPPNSFFGPGLVQPLRRDEAGINFGIDKPLVSGGQASLLYNPQPAYFFVSDPTGSGFNPIRTNSVQLSLTQPLLRGAGRKFNLIPVQISQIGIAQSSWEFKKTLIQSVGDIITQYWELYAARSAIKAIDEVIPLFEEIVRLQKEALAVGQVVDADVAKAEAQLYDFQQDKLRLEGESVDQELRLRNLIGLPPNVPWQLSPGTKPTNILVQVAPEELLNVASRHHPDIVQQHLNVCIRRLETEAANNLLKPQLDVNALYRLNGNGENLGEALDQLATFDFRDWELGASFSVPFGRRVAKGQLIAADRQLVEESEILQQRILSVHYDLSRSGKRLTYTYRQLEAAEKRLVSAEEWVKGARLRYQNPNPNDGGSNWLLENLNDYLDAIRFQTRAATEQAELLAQYNIELAGLEANKGTLLDFFGVNFLGDPCRQADHLTRPAIRVPTEPTSTSNAPRGSILPEKDTSRYPLFQDKNESPVLQSFESHPVNRLESAAAGN